MNKKNEDLKNFASKWNAKPHTEWSETAQAEARARYENDPSHKRWANNMLQKAYTSVNAIMDSGAGYFADKLIREYLIEFNRRFWTYGVGYWPTSFNVLNRFLNFSDKNYFVGLKEEVDHIFLPDDFFEFITDENYENDPIKAIKNFKDDIIYNYSVVGDPRVLKFKTDDKKDDFVVCGISMIKEKNELSWILVGGPIITEEIKKKIQEDKVDLLSSNAKSAKNLIVDPEALKPENTFAAPIDGLNDVWKNVVFGRTEIDKMTHQVRYLHQDLNTQFLTITDDPSVIPPKEKDSLNFDLTSTTEKILKENEKTLNSNPTLFNLAEALFNLPNYFNFKLQYVVTNEVKTSYGKNKNRLSAQKNYKYAPNDLKVFIKKVKALEIINPRKSPSIKRAYTSPQYQVNVDGFWRRLSADSYGKDKNGEEILGRTWIKAHLRWRGKLPKPKKIFLKSSITAAKEKLDLIKSRNEETLKEPFKEKVQIQDNDNGFVYIMRNPSMKENIFKIGCTRKSPTDRAEDLSDSTGVAEKFEVVEFWKCKNFKAAHSAEQEILASLDRYRISNNREFFKIDKDLAIKNINFVLKKHN